MSDSYKWFQIHRLKISSHIMIRFTFHSSLSELQELRSHDSHRILSKLWIKCFASNRNQSGYETCTCTFLFITIALCRVAPHERNHICSVKLGYRGDSIHPTHQWYKYYSTIYVFNSRFDMKIGKIYIKKKQPELKCKDPVVQ